VPKIVHYLKYTCIDSWFSWNFWLNPTTVKSPCRGGPNSQTFYAQLLLKYFCTRKLQSQNVTREKLHKALLYEKYEHEMLMKLTSGAKFTNILWAAFAQIFIFTKKYKAKNLSREKLRKTHLFKKLPIKCWWNWYQAISNQRKSRKSIFFPSIKVE